MEVRLQISISISIKAGTVELVAIEAILVAFGDWFPLHSWIYCGSFNLAFATLSLSGFP